MTRGIKSKGSATSLERMERTKNRLSAYGLRTLERDSPEAYSHEVQSIARAANEEQFHQGVVHAHTVFGDEIHIASDEDDEVEDLGLERNASTGSCGVYLV